MGRHGRARWVLGIACAAAFLSTMAITIVNVAVPDLQAAFPSAGPAGVSWVLTGFTIVFAALTVPAGRWADILGAGRVLVSGLALFAVGAAACAAAPTLPLVVSGRLVQAVGAAAMTSVSLALLLATYADGPARRGAVAVWTSSGALGVGAGPVLGGALVGAGGWRLVFVVLASATVLILSVTVWAAPRTPARAATGRLPDIVSTVLLIGGVGLLALAIVEAPEWGWTSARVLATLAVAAGMLALMLWRSARHPVPVVEPAVLASRPMRLGALGLVVFCVGFFATQLERVLFLTEVWRYSPLSAGIAFAPGPLVAAVVAVTLGRRLIARFGPAFVSAVGAALYPLAYAWNFLRLDAQPDYWAGYLPAVVATGLGAGLVFPAVVNAATSGLAAGRFGTGSAVVNMARQLGGVLGVALVFSLLAVAADPSSLGGFHPVWLLIMIATAASLVPFVLLRPAVAAVAARPEKVRQ